MRRILAGALLLASACFLLASQSACSLIMLTATENSARPTGEFEYQKAGRRVEVANPAFSKDAGKVSLQVDVLERAASCQAREKLDNGPNKGLVYGGTLVDFAIVGAGAYVLASNPCSDGPIGEDDESVPCLAGGAVAMPFAIPAVMSALLVPFVDSPYEWTEYGPKECPPGEPAPSFAAEVRIPDGSTITVQTDDNGRVPPGAISLTAGEWKAHPEIAIAADGAEGSSLDLRPFLGDLASVAQLAPARLELEVQFHDDGDQMLRALEAATLRVRVSNTGRGTAFAVLKPLRGVAAGLDVKMPAADLTLEPGESETFEIGLIGRRDLQDAVARLRVVVAERRGFDADPVDVEFKTRAFRPPKIVISGVEVDDDNKGESSGNSNGLVEPGEQVELTLVIQNQGEGIAKNVRLNLGAQAKGLILASATAISLGDLSAWQVARKKVVVVVTKRYAGPDALPLSFELAERDGKYGASGRLPITLRERAAALHVITVAAQGEKKVTISAANAIAEVDKPFPLSASKPNPHHWALIIGVEDYAKAPAATYSTRDAQRMADTLHHLGVPKENMKVLLNREATLASFRAALTWLTNNAGDGDRVYFYFSGHGVPGGKSTDEAFLVPYDGDPNYPRETTLPLDAVNERLAKLRAKEVIAFMDACFTGQNSRGKGESLLTNARPLVPNVNVKPVAPKVTLFSAARSNQISSGDEALQHGLFTNYLLLGMRGGADKDGDGRLSLRELHRFVSKRVTRHARRLNREQHPELQGSGTEWTIELGAKP